eukprot:jgi/Psemu1/18971/gm1.18971_g
MVPQCQKTYTNFKVYYRTHIKAEGRSTSVRYYKIPDGITCTNQFFNGAKESISSSLKLKPHFGVCHTEFSRSNQQVSPFVRYEMAVKRSIVEIQVETSVDEDIENCNKQWAVLNFDDNDMADKCQREEAKAAEGEITQHQKEHDCEDDYELDQDHKLKSKGFELAEHSKIYGKNKHSLKVKESKMKAQDNKFSLNIFCDREVTIYSDGVNVSKIPAGGDIAVSVRAGSIFQLSRRERVYSDCTVPSTLAPQEHRIVPHKLQVNLFYNKDINVYVNGQPAYNVRWCLAKMNMKTILYQIRMIMQTISFQRSIVRSLLLITLQYLLCQLMRCNSNLLCCICISNLWKVLVSPPTTD